MFCVHYEAARGQDCHAHLLETKKKSRRKWGKKNINVILSCETFLLFTFLFRNIKKIPELS